MNLTRVVDLILRREGVLEGVVVNNTTAEMAGHDIIHVDPIALESKIVVDATGHDAVVVNLLHKRGLYTRSAGQRRHVGVALGRRGHGSDRRSVPELFRHRLGRRRRTRYATDGPGVRLDAAIGPLWSGVDQEEIEAGIAEWSPCLRLLNKRLPEGAR